MVSIQGLKPAVKPGHCSLSSGAGRVGGGSRFSVFSHPGRHKSSRVEGVGFGGQGRHSHVSLVRSLRTGSAFG